MPAGQYHFEPGVEMQHDTSPHEVEVGGKKYKAQTAYNCVRKVSNGVITTVAGNGTRGYSGDNGPATSAQLDSPFGVALDSAGNLYIADGNNNRVREVSNGVITTVAGNGLGGFNCYNGPVASAQLANPAGVAVDSAGNLYIADTLNNCVRKVSNGVITTVAGNGTRGYSGDNGPATGAALYYPFGVALDSAGNLYIADTGNSRIREVSNSIINTLAGDGSPGFSGDNGPAANAELRLPWGVAVDSSGGLYIADVGNQRIRKVSNSIINTLAGDGTAGFGGDNGPATSAELHYPYGVAVDSLGNVYVADVDNNRVRVLLSTSVLSIAKSHTGNFTQGQTGAAYTVILSNGSAGPTSGVVTVVDTLPRGLTATAMSGTGWSCTLATLACTRSDVLAAGASYPAITVTVNVAANALPQVTNEVSATVGGSKGASASDLTTINLSTVNKMCDLNQDGTTNLSDVQQIINEALGVAPAVNDLSQDGVVNVVDVQIVINAVLGLGCTARSGSVLVASVK